MKEKEKVSDSEQGTRVMGIKRVLIAESETGYCLFDRFEAEWDDAPSAHSLCSLLHVFYQFSREIDSGQIGRILFEQPLAELERPQSAHPLSASQSSRSTTALHSDSSSYRIARSWNTSRPLTAGTSRTTRGGRSSRSVGLVCERSSQIIVCVLDDNHGPDASDARRLCRLIMSEFSGLYAEKLGPVCSRLTSLGEAVLTHEEHSQIMGEFSSYDYRSLIMKTVQAGVSISPSDVSLSVRL